MRRKRRLRRRSLPRRRRSRPFRRRSRPWRRTSLPRDAKKSAKKAKGQKVSGTIEALDVAAGTFTVKGKKGNVDLKAGEKVKLDSFKVGDKVYVKYADGTASSVKGVKATGRATTKALKKAGGDVEGAKTPAPTPAEKK